MVGLFVGGGILYAKVEHVLLRRRGLCNPVEVARTFSPCSRNSPCGPTLPVERHRLDPEFADCTHPKS